MQHLSALDALFLYLETPEMPMHVGSLILFEKPKGHRGSFYKNIRAHIQSRMHLAPLFTRKLAFMPLDLTNPVWVKDGRVDIDRHITRMILTKPGTQTQLEAAVARLHEGMLDRDQPLWEFTVIESLQSGLVGFYSKIHHAALDGQGGVALAQAVLDTEPAPRAVAAPGHRAAAMRRYFARDKAMFVKPMICAVPASLRVPGDTSHGNLVTMMLVNIATHIADPCLPDWRRAIFQPSCCAIF